MEKDKDIIEEEEINVVDEEEVNDTEDVVDTGADLDSTDEDELEKQRIPYKRFKEKVDEANRLKKELAKIEEDQKAEKLQEMKDQEKYKELYENALEEIENIKSTKVAKKKSELLKDAGYKDSQIERLSKLVEGDSEEEILESIEELKEVFPTKTYVDPSADNRKRSTPDSVDGEEIGRSLFDKILKSGKIKGYK